MPYVPRPSTPVQPHSVVTVLRILNLHPVVADCDLLRLWPEFSNGAGDCSHSTPSKARLRAVKDGLVRQAGYDKRNGRTVRVWELVP
jgi:hypothetical protein